MNTSTVKYWLLLIGVLAAGYASFVLYRGSGPQPADTPVAVTLAAKPTTDVAREPASSTTVSDFELTDQNGEAFDSARLDGQVWVASFFFTNCPSACWRMNQALSAYQQTHPDSQAHFVSITCDPDNDTPEALTTYAEHFKADPERWTFLTGDMQTIEDIGKDSFQISVVKKVHSDRACVVDRHGKVRGSFRLTEPEQVKMLEQLLAVVESEPADDSSAEPAPAEHPGDDAPQGPVAESESPATASS